VDEKDVLGIYSLFVSRLFSHLLITAGWFGLSPAYLMYHTFSCSESVRYVPSNPRYSPAFPSISPPPPPIDREHSLRYVSTTSSPLPRGSHYSLESTSPATAALNAGASMPSLDLHLDLDLSPSLSFVTFSSSSRSADNESMKLFYTFVCPSDFPPVVNQSSIKLKFAIFLFMEDYLTK
jgi:hypothetical protein